MSVGEVTLTNRRLKSNLTHIHNLSSESNDEQFATFNDLPDDVNSDSDGKRKKQSD